MFDVVANNEPFGKCSRTRLEFKDHICYSCCKIRVNAVAPDWNLKRILSSNALRRAFNAVAPDWNLKSASRLNVLVVKSNAVAPDWNLKNALASSFNVLSVMQSHQIGI